MPPMNPAPTNAATAPAVNPGADSGPVGDCERDVAGEGRHEEVEGKLADRDQHGAEVLPKPPPADSTASC